MANNGGGNQPEQESLWDRISRGLVVDFATAIAAFYAIGLLIVNLDLGRYGLVAVDLARPEYVVVGLLWTILVTLTIAAIWFVTWLVLDVTWPSALFKPFGRAAGLLALVVVVPSVLAFYILVLGVVSGGGLKDMFHPWFLNLVMGLVVQSLLIMVTVRVLFLLRALIRGERKSAERRVSILLFPFPPSPDAPESSRILALFLAIGTSIAFGLVGFFVYTLFVFSQIPREWGGGTKQVVELFLTEKLPVFADRKDIPLTTDGKRIGPVICILETERVLIIASLNYPYWSEKDAKTFAVDRKVVTAVEYEGGYRPSSTFPLPLVASPNPASSPSVNHQLRTDGSTKLHE